MKWTRTIKGDPDYEEIIRKRGGWLDKTVIAILIAVLAIGAALILLAFFGV